MSDFLTNLFSMYQCGLRKGFSAQHCLVATLKKWKSCNENGKSFAALMADLSKAFSYLSHDLIITKLHAYGFNKQALELMNSYLSEGKQITKLGVRSLQFLEGNSVWSPSRGYFRVCIQKIQILLVMQMIIHHGSIDQII